ncbi:MAG: hypothetical protein RLZZ584_1841, partial [Pseudomonadota bacterium]
YVGPDHQRRREVLRETIAAFSRCEPPQRYHQLAVANLARWRREGEPPSFGMKVHVVPGDWGDVTLGLSKNYGACFAVLNMANAHYPGGAYPEGAVAQEENMFRRTDCHLRVTDEQLADDGRTYTPAMSDLLNGVHGRVYLDTHLPCVCIRGSENRSAADLGYGWLADKDVFAFYEMRAAAQDLRGGAAFDAAQMRRRIVAQLETLQAHRVRHVVLGAFGCGAFRNPARPVAQIYREELLRRSQAFSVVAFAIYAAGYGPDNYTPFAQVLADLTTS